MKYAPTYFHHHMVMRDFNGALLIHEPESEALYDMHRAIRNRDEMGMAVAYDKFVGAMDRSTPEMRTVLRELVAYIQRIGSDAEYESFIYDLDSQGPVGAPMWRMSPRALKIVRDLARNRTHRIDLNEQARLEERRNAERLLTSDQHSAFSSWATEICREVGYGVLRKGQFEAILGKRETKFSDLHNYYKVVTLKQLAVQQRDNATSPERAAEQRCDFICSILDAVYRDPETAIPIVESARASMQEKRLFLLPRPSLSLIKRRLENKESLMDIAADAPDTASEAEAYTLDKFAADARAAYDNAAEKGRIARIDLSSDLEGFKKRANQAGLSPSLVQVILYTIGTDTIVKSLSGE